MGKKRWSDWELLHMKHEIGKVEKPDIYGFLSTLQEAHLAFSFQWKLMLENHIWLATKLSEHYKEGMLIGELGCCTGLFVDWIALNFPNSAIIGFDSLPSLLNIANSSYRRENISFINWDYRQNYPNGLEKVDCLLSAFGIDFLPNSNFHEATDPSKIDSSERYIFCKNEAVKYFNAWRQAANDECLLFSTLRISSYCHFLALVDAAEDCGWRLVIDQSAKLKADEEVVPAMVFTTLTTKKSSWAELLAFWCQGIDELKANKILYDAEAVYAFLNLEEKEMKVSEDYTFDDGHTMVTSLGTTKQFGFSYSMATTGFARLEIVPKNQFENLRIRFQW